MHLRRLSFLGSSLSHKSGKFMSILNWSRNTDRARNIEISVAEFVGEHLNLVSVLSIEDSVMDYGVTSWLHHTLSALAAHKIELSQVSLCNG